MAKETFVTKDFLTPNEPSEDTEPRLNPLYEARLQLATLEAKNRELARLLRESDMLLHKIVGDYNGEFQQKAWKHVQKVGLFLQGSRY